MAAQALLSSAVEAGRQLLGGRPLQASPPDPSPPPEALLPPRPRLRHPSRQGLLPSLSPAPAARLSPLLLRLLLLSSPSGSAILTSFRFQGADRQLWFASKQSLSYLDGSLPGDFGFDPLGLSDPEGTGGFIEPRWLAYGEVINGRFAMLGAAGAIAPEIFGKLGLIPPETALPWFKTGVIPPAGTYPYWADSYTLFVLEMALMGFAEHRRYQDWAKPGSMGKQYFLGLEKGLGGSGDPAYPGGPSSTRAEAEGDQEWTLGHARHLGVLHPGAGHREGPFQNLLDHLADPVNNNVLTSLKFH
ncbi:unnamed protein product [Spirodela intermedia]|uniref:Chlorophyll a-b binding protein, chloroplastic n=1 Tax=Spirodela intermedia TaxID=51605 RepID=A0A7I8JQG1_SPIIN|nr:unnamed protein product [Spirodela intermedia]CAA6672376.1 unnamed protein product [Spirodela intermedia]